MNKEPKFLVDFMLGRLSKWLRIFGYDAKYIREKTTVTPVLESLKENRILLTRNSRLSEKRAWKLILVKSDKVGEQLKQVADELELDISKKRLFSRCSVCNCAIEPVADKNTIKAEIPEYVFNTQNAFSKCVKCGKIYWQGTHYELLLKELRSIGLKVES